MYKHAFTVMYEIKVSSNYHPNDNTIQQSTRQNTQIAGHSQTLTRADTSEKHI